MGAPFDDLPPELLEAFYGKEPLESVAPHFSTKRDLLAAYARAQSDVFGPATMRGNTCNLCERVVSPVGRLEVDWKATVRWQPARLLLILPALPVLIILAYTHLEMFFHSALRQKRIEVVERVSFTTWFTVCAECRRQFLWREMARLLALVVGMLGMMVAGGFLLYFGFMAILAFLQGPIQWASFLWLLLESLMAIAALVALPTLGLPMVDRFTVPSAARRLAKAPFRPFASQYHRGLS